MSSVLATTLRFQEPAQRSFPHETVRRQRHSDVLQLQVAFQAFEFPYSAVPATAAKFKLHCTAGLLQRWHKPHSCSHYYFVHMFHQ